jgi:hypothetical protein
MNIISTISTLNTSLIADGIVAFLLVITIFYAAKLSRKLNALRADKAALHALIQNLTVASQSAEAGVGGLKAAAADIGRLLERKLQEGQSLREDLAYMIDRGGGVADRLEGTLRTRHEETRPEPVRPRAVEAPRAQPEAPLRREARGGASNLIQEMASRLVATAPSRAERDLARALAGRR